MGNQTGASQAVYPSASQSATEQEGGALAQPNMAALGARRRHVTCVALECFPCVILVCSPLQTLPGVRNTVGFDFHPDTGQLVFTDNGRDGR